MTNTTQSSHINITNNAIFVCTTIHSSRFSRIKPILGRVLYFKRRSLSRTRPRWLSTRRIHPIHLLETLRPQGRVRRQVQPRDAPEPLIVLTGRRTRWSRDGINFLDGGAAILVVSRVKVEDGAGGVCKEVVAREVDVLAGEGGGGVGGEGEFEGNQRDKGQVVGPEGGYAGRVVERCKGTHRDGNGGAVGEVTGIILRASADCDVHKGAVGRWERSGCWVED